MDYSAQTTPDLDTLARLFYPSLDRLGQFEEVAASELPERYRRQLSHDEHMTVTLESFYGGPVDVAVLQKKVTDTHYARKILLLRRNDGLVVQYGIMRVNLAYLDGAVRAQIESEATPLGRILIQHNVLRQIQLDALWRVMPAADLSGLFNLETSAVTYARTALIKVQGEPAVELVEIVRPLVE